jgi:hypothetical protein
MTLFLMPTIYAVMNRRDDERKARADARREEIASGHRRKRKAIASEEGIETEGGNNAEG